MSEVELLTQSQSQSQSRTRTQTQTPMPLSYSRIALYQTCPKQYEFACVKKIPRNITPAESFGSSVHNTLKKWGELELAYQSPVKVNEQLTMFAPEVAAEQLPRLSLATLLDVWEEKFIRSTYATHSDALADYTRGKQCLEHFFNWWGSEQRIVQAIETSFKYPVGNNVLTGRFDRIEAVNGKLHIIDFKTSRIKEQQFADENLQLSLYVLAAQQQWGLPVASVRLLFVTEQNCTEVISARSSEQLTEAQVQFSAAYAGIEHAEFTATPSIKKCSYCPYSSVCSSAMV